MSFGGIRGVCGKKVTRNKNFNYKLCNCSLTFLSCRVTIGVEASLGLCLRDSSFTRRSIGEGGRSQTRSE